MGAGIQIADAKAPWIMFDRRAVEDRNETIKQGRYVAKDVDFVLITPHGSKDQIEREVEDWLLYCDQQVRENRLDPTWLAAYRSAYSNYKAGKEIPLEGTPIINWPLLSPAQVRMLQDLHILTVEVLALANEETIRRLGMGGRSLVQKAKDFLAQANNGGKVTEEMGAMRAQIETLLENQKRLEESNQLLRMQLAAPQGTGNPSQAPEQTPSGDGIGANDLLDAPVPTLKKL